MPSTQALIRTALLACALSAATTLAAGCDDGDGALDGGGAPCIVGTPGCACRASNACASGASCQGDVCVDCVDGLRGCPCDDERCEDDSVCMADTCVAPSCSLGAEGCPCRSGDVCDEALSCVDDTCTRCTNDVPGCPCENDRCSGGLICDQDACRVPRTCEDLVQGGACASVEVCIESSSGRDAVCLECTGDAGDCACSGGACGAFSSCVAGAAGSILDQCTRQYRVCVEEEDGARCGDCLSGEPNESGECVVDLSCGGEVCEPSEYCDRSEPSAPVCAERPCPPGGAADVANDDACVECTRSCNYPGATGDYWPFTDKAGNCLCDTLPGFFNAGGSTAAPTLCDADGDGWVNDFLRDPNLIGDARDQALADTARCDVRLLAKIVLIDEYGMQLELHSCRAGLQSTPCSDEADIEPIRLLETKRNDTPGDPESSASTATPSVGAGRRLRANELTALTKVCTASLGDFDDDGNEDIDQVQNRVPVAEGDRLASFAHFIELYRSRYEPPSEGRYGTLVIEERNRCSASSFPLSITASDTGYDADRASSYWRNCYRKRDASYAQGSTDPGNDFAQWTCAATTGSCPTAPPASPSVDATTPLDPATDALLRDFGLCELGDQAPADGMFRGLGHSSQFRCVQIVNAASTNPRDRQAVRYFNECRAGAGSSGSGLHPREPEIQCSPVTSPERGAVGWEIANFQAYRQIGTDGQPMDTRDYTRGCVTEDTEWPYLCQHPEFDGLDANVAADAAVLSNTFGRFRCYGWSQSFLWAPETGDLELNQLAWSEDSGPAPNMSVWGPGSRP